MIIYKKIDIIYIFYNSKNYKLKLSLNSSTYDVIKWYSVNLYIYCNFISFISDYWIKWKLITKYYFYRKCVIVSKNLAFFWEQRKFSEGVSEIGDGLHGTPIYCEDGNVYFINGNNLVDGKIVISAETKKVNESQQSTADKSLDDITILMSINGTIGNLAYYSGERLMLGKSAAYIKVSEFDKRFVYAYLQAPSVQGYFMDSLTGTTIKNLGLKAIREMIMFIPQDVDEQKRIGKFFDYLDHLITLHQSKCDNLKELKKYMLQNMFIW